MEPAPERERSSEPPLPPSATDYFRLMDRDDKRPVVELFAPDAHVTDDGRSYRGREAILGWLTNQASAFTTTSTRLSATATESRVEVVVRIEGDFPGGRVDLHHHVVLGQTGLIESLSITA